MFVLILLLAVSINIHASAPASSSAASSAEQHDNDKKESKALALGADITRIRETAAAVKKHFPERKDREKVKALIRDEVMMSVVRNGGSEVQNKFICNSVLEQLAELKKGSKIECAAVKNFEKLVWLGSEYILKDVAVSRVLANRGLVLPFDNQGETLYEIPEEVKEALKTVIPKPHSHAKKNTKAAAGH